MRVFTFIILLLTTATAFSATYIKGVIEKNTLYGAGDYLADYKHEKFSFPRKHYEVNGFYIGLIDYDSSYVLNNKKFNLKDYNFISSIGSLDLIAFDKSTGKYKFKLSVNPSAIQHVQRMSATLSPKIKELEIKGGVKFDNKYECYLEGVFKDHPPRLINTVGKNSCSIQIEFQETNGRNEHFTLTPKADIPVTVVIE